MPGDIIILHLCTTNNHMMYGSSDMESTKDRIFCHFGLFFALLPSNNLENKNVEKMKKAPGDIISLHMCTINENHMYGSWDIECNRQNFFVILDHFFLFNPPNKPENQNLEKWKKPSDIIILHLCTTNDVWLLRYGVRQTRICYFGLFFALLPL